MNSASSVLYNSFQGVVYKKFCDTVGKDPNTHLTQIVDNHGNVVPSRRKRSPSPSDFWKRTPPPDENSNDGVTFSLIWTGGDGNCASGCTEAFDLMTTSPCAHLGGEQNDMAISTSLDTGCGSYSYKINQVPPPAPVPTICPAPGNKNLAQNRCDDKCMGKGWGKCDPDQPGVTNKYTCYCNDGPCGGQQCGDPVKIDKLTNKGTKCPVSLTFLTLPFAKIKLNVMES